jgi:predicted  nucleic acid-binding Zn-ribbon protein
VRSTLAGGRTFYLGIAVTGELRLIHDLQSLDARILAVRAELEQAPRDLARLDAEQARHQGALDLARQQREDCLKKRRGLELDVETRNAGIRKLQAQQIQVKTNKEYTAMLH